MDNTKVKEIFEEILENHFELAKTIATYYDELGPYDLDSLIKEFAPADLFEE